MRRPSKAWHQGKPQQAAKANNTVGHAQRALTSTWWPSGGFTPSKCLYSTSVPGKMRMRSCCLASLAGG